MKANGKQDPIELGRFIVADPGICHGKPTYKGTRIMVWQVLDELAHGMSSNEIVKAWGGRVSADAVAETIQLARRSFLNEKGRLRDKPGRRRLQRA
ncbi:MAG: hypothetical protein C5B50_29960 [Verrucomicrobia bacterium]|nr:MAG: hypothetical protein C5B50_29960 [Verrucomicrobiota bacterium]